MSHLLLQTVLLLVSVGQETDNETALLLARSCVGEAGFDAAERGECAAIWHVYRKRAELLNKPIDKITRKYSAAVKRGRHNAHRKWIFGLDATGRKPRGWSSQLDWNRYRMKWLITLALAEQFLSGSIPDPIPQAQHYGGPMDHKLDARQWRRIKTERFANWFYVSRRYDR